jgi:hypothetical protein
MDVLSVDLFLSTKVYDLVVPFFFPVWRGAKT